MFEHLVGSSSKLKMKPGLIFLLRLAWDSRVRLPLLIMSGFMVFGLRIQMEINIDRTSRFLPRLRLDDDEIVITSDEEMDSDNEDGDDDDDETDNGGAHDDETTSWLSDSNCDTEQYDSYDEELVDSCYQHNACSPSPWSSS
ncbi:Hypothetical protein NTJ_11329 [Nesidiocoris tenuis]|uniref:Uncharacterized protein n=1 Tax=Nesidiocoris tenuis TaxID=355587 RepID=A0ABN7B270_9HEMI|nr:Hypothetical protein NTJ_11329 [Nesidiocoris tenuis]